MRAIDAAVVVAFEVCQTYERELCARLGLSWMSYMVHGIFTTVHSIDVTHAAV